MNYVMMCQLDASKERKKMTSEKIIQIISVNTLMLAIFNDDNKMHTEIIYSLALIENSEKGIRIVAPVCGKWLNIVYSDNVHYIGIARNQAEARSIFEGRNK